jgi:succinate dehydrogenase / fumarate reductase, membrane anchor subunit
MKTPLGRVRGMGATHSGTEHFWLQRLTAVANLPLLVGFLIIMVALVGRGHATVIATLTNPFVAILVLAAVISVVIHMRIGMQVIIEDYVHSEGRKILLLMANTFFSFGLGLAAIYAILKINFGL